MKYLSVIEIAKKWQVSDRMVRNYCASGRIDGAYLVGKTWNIPANATKPQRQSKKYSNNILHVLKEQKDMNLPGSIYHKTQIELTYNSNHIEGSTLTHEQTRFIFETNTISIDNTRETLNVDDIVETTNHFKCIDFCIDNATKTITENMIKKLHYMLKSGTSDSKKDWFNVGDYKKLPNEVGGKQTCKPKDVAKQIKLLLDKYNAKENKTLKDIVAFHKQFEDIHPFQDGNGRIGRLIMFKECLANNIIPFIIDEEHKLLYYRGLKEWDNETGFLIDTCKSCQDKYKAWLEYFEIKY